MLPSILIIPIIILFPFPNHNHIVRKNEKNNHSIIYNN